MEGSCDHVSMQTNNSLFQKASVKTVIVPCAESLDIGKDLINRFRSASRTISPERIVALQGPPENQPLHQAPIAKGFGLDDGTINS